MFGQLLPNKNKFATEQHSGATVIRGCPNWASKQGLSLDRDAGLQCRHGHTRIMGWHCIDELALYQSLVSYPSSTVGCT
jgi:hypothetical protein